MGKRINVNGAMDYNQFTQQYNQRMQARGVYCSICGQDLNGASLNSANNPEDRRIELQYGKHRACAERQYLERMRY